MQQFVHIIAIIMQYNSVNFAVSKSDRNKYQHNLDCKAVPGSGSPARPSPYTAFHIVGYFRNGTA